MYGKIFESMYDGTLSADWKAMVTFQQMIVLADSEGVVDYTPPALSRRTGIPLEIIEHGIEKLEQPDKYSRSPDMGGCRISRLDDHRPWGWTIVNYEQYRDLAKVSEKREQSRDRKRRQRERQAQASDSKDMSQNVTQGHASSRMSRHISVSTSTSESSSVEKEEQFEEFKSAFPNRAGGQPWQRARKAINARLKEGHTYDEIIDGARRYALFIEHTGKLGTEYVMQAATFCGRDKHFENEFAPPKDPSSRNRKPSYAEELREGMKDAGII